MNEELLALLQTVPSEIAQDTMAMYEDIDNRIEAENCADCGNDGMGGMQMAAMVVANCGNNFPESLEY